MTSPTTPPTVDDLPWRRWFQPRCTDRVTTLYQHLRCGLGYEHDRPRPKDRGDSPVTIILIALATIGAAVIAGVAGCLLTTYLADRLIRTDEGLGVLVAGALGGLVSAAAAVIAVGAFVLGAFS